MLRNKRLALRTGSTIWRNIFSARPGPDLGFTRNRTGFSAGKLNAAIDSAAARTNKQQWTIGTFHFRTKLGVGLIQMDLQRWFLRKILLKMMVVWTLDEKDLNWLREMPNIPAYVDRAETSTMQKIWQSPALYCNNNYPCVKNDRNMFFVFSSCLLVSKTMSQVVDPD